MISLCAVEEGATNGPVSTMARRMAAESLEMFGIGRQVGDAGIYGSACAFHQFREAMLARFARSFEDKPQTFLDQVLELATTQRCFRLGPAVESV